MENARVVVASRTVDGVASAVLAARSARSAFEVIFLDSEGLPGFFVPSMQQKLPPFYELIICDLGVMRRNWDGELIRPALMDRLRELGRPVRWFSCEPWMAEDRAAVGHIIGEGNLVVNQSAPCTASLVREALVDEAGPFEEGLVELAGGGAGEGAAEWVGKWRSVISALKDAPAALAEAISPLISARPEQVSEELLERAARTEQANREFAKGHVGEPVAMRESKLVTIELPPERHAFWAEISEYARADTGAEFCLCRLRGRPVALLTRAQESRTDLRPWVRYLTDLMPAARNVGNRPEAAPIVIEGLNEDPALLQEAVNLLRDGAHLLKSG